MQAGDVLLSLGGAQLESDARLSFLLRRIPVGTSVAVRVKRGDVEVALKVVLEEMTDAPRSFRTGIRIVRPQELEKYLGPLTSFGFLEGRAVCTHG